MMTDTFDPYQKWLGIPPKQQPPNPYRLLGIELFESDPDVIEHAADRQMAYLRSFQAGKHSDACQSLLNEVASARFSLLDRQQKSAIDRRLKASMAATPPSSGKKRKSSRSKPYPTARPLDAMPVEQTSRSHRPATPIPVSSIPAGQTTPASRVSPTNRPTPVPLAGADSTPTPTAAPFSSSVSAKRRKSSRNALLEGAKVFVGGVAGIAIGLLILWFVFHEDPSRLISSGPSDPTPGAGGPTAPVVHPQTPKVPDSNPAGGPSPSDPSDPFLPLEPDSVVLGDGALIVERPGWLKPSEPAIYGVRDVPDYSPMDLDDAMTAATEVAPIADRLASDVTLSPDEQKRLARQLHETFCRLADVITFADFGQAAVQMHLTQVERMLRQLGDSTPKLKALGIVSRQRWLEDTPDGRGILLTGTIEQIRAERQLYVTRLRLAASDETLVSVYSWKDPAMFCKVGETALVLGHLVDNPQDNLAGYEGQDPRAVWGGYLVTVPTRQP